MNSTAYQPKRASVLYYVLLVAAVIYFLTITFSNFVDWQVLLPFLKQNFQITPQNFLPVSLFYNVRLTNDIVYPGAGKIFFACLMLVGLYGGFVLSKGRNFIEALGLFLFYTIPKPNYFWGKLTDQTTGRPIPFGRVEVRDINPTTQSADLVAETIADMFGRYRVSFTAEPQRTYQISTIASDFQVHTRLMSSATNTVVLYGDIELVPVNKQPSAFALWGNKIKTHFEANVVNYLYVVSLVSLAVITPSVITNFQPWTVFYFGIALGAVLWNTYIISTTAYGDSGRLILIETGEPVKGILVTLWLEGKKLATAVSNSSGELSFSVDPGVYELRLLSDAFELMENQSSTLTKSTTVTIDNRGSIVNDILLHRTSATSPAVTGALINPFA